MNELNKLIEKLISEKGGTREQYLHLLSSISNHETGGTNSPTQKQVGGGPGRGKYQFETGKNKGAITAARRLKNYMGRSKMSVPSWLNKATKGDDLDASTLTSEQQDALFLGNMREHPKADFKKVWDNEQSITDFWANNHFVGKTQASKRKGIKNFDKNYKELSKTTPFPKLTGPKDENRGDTRRFPEQKEPTKQFIPRPNGQNQYSVGGSLRQSLYGEKFNHFGTGGTHESNPNGGIPVGIGANGKTNTVEQGETSYKFKTGKYIFSDRIGTDGKVNSMKMNEGQFGLGGDPIKGEPEVKKQDNTTVNYKPILNLKDLQNKKLANTPVEEKTIYQTIRQGFSDSPINPNNWFVTDYTEDNTKEEAYSKARAAGESEYIYKRKRYNTNYDGTPEEQLQETGITDDQIQGTGNPIRNRLANNLDPEGYWNPVKRFIDATLYNEKSKGKRYKENLATKGGLNDENARRRLDANSLYSGHPQKYNTFSVSKYKPTKATDSKATYYSITNEKLRKQVLDSAGRADFNGSKVVADRTGVMRDYTLTKGTDEKGDYISYYDKWDINALPKVIGKISKKLFGKELTTDYGKPIEIYDRIYYTKDKNGKLKIIK